MRRDDWKWILKKEYITGKCFFKGTEGIMSLLIIKEISEPVVKHLDSKDVVIADRDYSWLQIALKGQYFWITAMFDDRNEFVEAYIDITDGNDLSDPEDPCFEDMYLDIVVTDDARVFILDRDELDAAFKNKEIDAARYNRTISECEKLYDYLLNNTEEFISFCKERFTELKG